MSSVSRFLLSRSSQHLFSNISGLAQTYGTYKYYNEQQRANLINAEQYNISQQSLLNSTQEYSDTAYLNYLENYNIASSQERNVVGKTSAYFASRGVEVFGSAVQDMYKNVNAMENTKTDLYENYVRNLYRYKSGAENKMSSYSLLGSEAKHKANENRWFGVLNTGLTGLQAISNL